MRLLAVAAAVAPALATPSSLCAAAAGHSQAALDECLAPPGGDDAASALQIRAAPPEARVLTVDDAREGAASAERYVPGSKLVVRNGCGSAPMWIASMVQDKDRSLFPNNIKLDPGQSFTFAIPAGRVVAATRFWPKMGCKPDGTQCKLGSSGGPGQDCPMDGCAPPVDTKFEATFGDQNTAQPVDWWDTSGVDGYTLPYTLTLDSGCPHGQSLDCSRLSMADCPKEILNNHLIPLKVTRDGTNETLGCYSPCGKLTYTNWRNSPTYTPWDSQANMFCCPTPPVSPEACRTGPVEQTKYVQLFRRQCQGVYSYAYDDAVGLQTCPVGTTYTWTIQCPL